MTNVNDFYAGILKPDGGLFQPGPPVMLPPQGGNGLPPQSSAVALGKALSAAPVNAVNPLDISHLGLINDPFRTPATSAIQQVAPNMSFEASNPAQAPSGDVWSGLRNPGEASVPQSGMTTANTGRNIASYLPAGSPASALMTGGLGAMFAATPIGKLLGGLSQFGGTNTPSAAPSGLAALPAGAGYLQALGQNTGGSAGQVSNAFRDALASSSRQSGSGPGSQ